MSLVLLSFDYTESVSVILFVLLLFLMAYLQDTRRDLDFGYWQNLSTYNKNHF